MEPEVGVFVTDHAIRRFEERFPEEKTADTAGRIFMEVHRALQAGRRAKRKPRWITFVNRSKHAAGWYVWTADERRCYIIESRRAGTSRFAKCYAVKTCLRPYEQAGDRQQLLNNHVVLKRKERKGGYKR